MINSYSNTSQSVDVNKNLIFDVNRIKTTCAIRHTEGTATFALTRPGYYFVSFNADVAATTTAGDVIVQLQSNNEAVSGAVATNTSTDATDIENIGFTTIINVKPGCCVVDNSTTLTLINSGVAATFSNMNLVITKIC